MMKKQRKLIAGVLTGTLLLAAAAPAGAALLQKTIEVSSGISVYVDEKKLQPTDANGKPVDVFASDGTTYLPLRALSEALGKNVSWNGTSNTVNVGGSAEDDKDAEYLQTYFGIAPFSGTVSRAGFDAALAKIGGTATTGTGALTVAEATQAAVDAAGMKELAISYTNTINPDKAAQRLAAYDVDGVAAEYAPYVACALDTDLVPSTYDFDTALTAQPATELLMAAADQAGRGRKDLGMASDSDIYAKLRSAWASFTNFNDDKLSALGAQLVLQGASTGYGLKYDGYNANFLPQYTLKYGHSDIQHAVQLIGLLNSQGIDAKVQLEPKVSIYEYLTDWGDPTKVQATPTYQLRQIEGGRWLCYAMEYDLMLEFNTESDKETFDGIIADYAKKNDDRVDAKGNVTAALLAGSWWQPLYSSAVPMQASDFNLLKDNVIRDGAYSIHPFSLPENSAKIAAVVAKEAPDLKVEPTDLYVDAAFYRYITNTDYQ